MTIVTVGIDLAKNVFAVHGVDATGKPVLVRPSVSRGKLLELISTLPPCLMGMEACSGAYAFLPACVSRPTILMGSLRTRICYKFSSWSRPYLKGCSHF